MSTTRGRRFIIEQGIGSAIVNLVMNGAIAWALFRSLTSVPLWGQHSIASDTLVTTFLLPLHTCLIVTPLTRRRIRSGSLSPVEWRYSSDSALGRLPRKAIPCALVFGVISLILAAPLALGALTALEVAQMSFERFVVFKATFAAMLAAVVTPAIGLYALAEGPQGFCWASGSHGQAV